MRTDILYKPKQAYPQEFFPYKSFDDLPVYDHRYLPRWETGIKAYYRTNDIHVITKTQVKDLNYNGACLYVSEDIHPNHKLDLRIYLSDKQCFEARGTVVWRKTSNDKSYLAGIVFDTLPEETQGLILRYAFEVN